MHADFGQKQQIDNKHLTRRVNNEGRLIGSRVRHVTWLHTYHVRGVIDSYQFHAGFKLGYLWNRVCGSGWFPKMRFNDLPRAIITEYGDSELPTMLKEAIASIKRPNAREAAIDISVFDIDLGKRRIDNAREGLTAMADHFKRQRKSN